MTLSGFPAKTLLDPPGFIIFQAAPHSEINLFTPLPGDELRELIVHQPQLLQLRTTPPECPFSGKICSCCCQHCLENANFILELKFVPLSSF